MYICHLSWWAEDSTSIYPWQSGSGRRSMTIYWWWNYACEYLTLLLPQSLYLSSSQAGISGRALHSQQTGTMSLACLVPLQVSLPFGNSLLSICFAPMQSVQPDGNGFEIYLFKPQLHISPLMFLVGFSSCPCLSRLAAAPSLQALLSPGLSLSEHPNLQRHFCHGVSVTGALICTAANKNVCHTQQLCQSWTAAEKNPQKYPDEEAFSTVGSCGCEAEEHIMSRVHRATAGRVWAQSF